MYLNKSNDIFMKFGVTLLNFDTIKANINCEEEAVDSPIKVDNEAVDCFIEEAVAAVVDGSTVVEDEAVDCSTAETENFCLEDSIL